MKLALLALSLVPALVPAQDKVYRCGPDGRTYSATPCPEGREVPVADPRSAEQRREAQETAQREAALAGQLSRERHQRERARPAGAATLSPPRPPASAASQPKPHKPHKKGRKSAGRHAAEHDPAMSEPVRAPRSP